MESESIVYGCIRDWPGKDDAQARMRRALNARELAALPTADSWSLLGREMFSCVDSRSEGLFMTQVIHFGASYRSVEYEWGLWVEQFEALLNRLYWSSAVVHLETELNGVHTFRWESEQGLHSPLEGGLRVRCAWEREGNLRG